MTWSGIGKFLLGIILAIAILIGGSAVLALYFMYKVTTPPPKPVFANETVPAKAQTPPATKPTQPTPSPAAQSAAKPASDESSSANPLEPGEYIARVTWPQGLILRAEPNLEAEQTGGLENDQRIVVLEESADKKWQRVRLEDGEQEGWVKAGNIERVQE
jgi:cytoskeletal protein RodZ